MLRPLVALSLCLVTSACAVRWTVQDPGHAPGEQARALSQRYHARLERAVALINEAKVPVPIRDTLLLNSLGFETVDQAPVLAAYANGKEVRNDMTRFQRAVASFGDDAGTIMHDLDQAHLLDPNPDYQKVKLTEFYPVRDAIMESDLGGMLTKEVEGAIFIFPLAGARAYAERQLDFRALVNGSVVQTEAGQALTGHLY